MSYINEIFESGIEQCDFINQKDQTDADFHSNRRAPAILQKERALAQVVHHSGSMQSSLQNLRCDRAFKAGGSAEVNLKVTWGDEDGVKLSGGAAGKYEDKHGNYVRGEANVDQDGRGSAEVAAGHKSED